jgi:uncharacterized protein YjeT (DUF2065 family)
MTVPPGPTLLVVGVGLIAAGVIFSHRIDAVVKSASANPSWPYRGMDQQRIRGMAIYNAYSLLLGGIALVVIGLIILRWHHL